MFRPAPWRSDAPASATSRVGRHGVAAKRGDGVSEPYQFGDLMLLSGTANPELSEKIAREIDLPLASMEITRFADGEFDVKIAESVRGRDLFLIQPTCQPVSDNLIQLFVILDALRRASASRITAVIPYYGYQRKEKKTQPRDPISAKLMANIIELAGANRVIAVDLHAEAIQGFFDIPVDALTATKILARRVRERHGHNVVVVSPDTGGALAPAGSVASSTRPSPSSTSAVPAMTPSR